MSTLKELLKDVPVEWKALGNIANFRRGSFPQPYGNSEWYDGEGSMPFIQVNDVGFNMKLVKKTKNRISIKAQPKSVFVPKNTVIVTLQGSIGRVAITQYDTYVDRTLAIFENYKKEIDIKYFAYQLEAKFNIEKDKARGNIIKTITKDDFKKFEIPIPFPNDPQKSLAIQQEIVRVLDNLSEQNKALTSALAQEIDQRKKQYEYYREELFRFEGKEVEWKTLGEVADNLDSMRKPVKSGSRDLGNIPYYGASGIVDYVKDYIFDGDYLLVSEDGANLLARSTPIAFSINGKSWVNNHAHILRFENHYQRQLVEYYLNSIDLEPYITGAAQPKLNQKNLNKIKVPVIIQEFELERIIRLLDQFDEGTKSIVAQLEKEIELRNKQYEYYRNELLGFNG